MISRRCWQYSRRNLIKIKSTSTCGALKIKVCTIARHARNKNCWDMRKLIVLLFLSASCLSTRIPTHSTSFTVLWKNASSVASHAITKNRCRIFVSKVFSTVRRETLWCWQALKTFVAPKAASNVKPSRRGSMTYLLTKRNALAVPWNSKTASISSWASPSQIFGRLTGPSGCPWSQARSHSAASARWLFWIRIGTYWWQGPWSCCDLYYHLFHS